MDAARTGLSFLLIRLGFYPFSSLFMGGRGVLSIIWMEGFGSCPKLREILLYYEGSAKKGFTPVLFVDRGEVPGNRTSLENHSTESWSLGLTQTEPTTNAIYRGLKKNQSHRLSFRYRRVMQMTSRISEIPIPFLQQFIYHCFPFTSPFSCAYRL